MTAGTDCAMSDKGQTRSLHTLRRSGFPSTRLLFVQNRTSLSRLRCYQKATWPMHGGKQQPGDKCKMIDEKAELGLVARPVRGPMEGDAKKQHIGSRK